LSNSRIRPTYSSLVVDAKSRFETGGSCPGGLSYQNLGEQVKAHNIDLEDIAIVERREDGKVKLHQASMAGSGAVWAA